MGCGLQDIEKGVLISTAILKYSHKIKLSRFTSKLLDSLWMAQD